MSIKTWKAMFMPTPATAPRTARQALAHSLRKWRGLTWENLAKHGLKPTTVTMPTADDCALCEMFLCLPKGADAPDKGAILDALDNCSGCPLFESRSRVRCDTKNTYEPVSPYYAFIDYGDARPMIAALVRAKTWLEIVPEGRKDREARAQREAECDEHKTR